MFLCGDRFLTCPELSSRMELLKMAAGSMKLCFACSFHALLNFFVCMYICVCMCMTLTLCWARCWVWSGSEYVVVAEVSSLPCHGGVCLCVQHFVMDLCTCVVVVFICVCSIS